MGELMSKLRFTEDDFDDDQGGYGPYADKLAGIAQKLFDAWLEAQRPCYIEKTGDGVFIESIHSVSFQGATHTARLVCIEEIVKKPCEHFPQIIRLPKGDTSDTWTNRTCKHCGIKLKATWSAE